MQFIWLRRKALACPTIAQNTVMVSGAAWWIYVCSFKLLLYMSTQTADRSASSYVHVTIVCWRSAIQKRRYKCHAGYFIKKDCSIAKPQNRNREQSNPGIDIGTGETVEAS